MANTLFSCNNAEQKDKSVYDYEIYKTQDIILAEEDNGKYVTYSNSKKNQLVNIDGKDVLILNMKCCSLSFYDLESGKKIHDILVDSLGKMKSFYFLGKDSIFISCSNISDGKELETPQAFRLIDWNGNVKKKYGYDVDLEELNNYKYDINKLIPPQKLFVFCKV